MYVKYFSFYLIGCFDGSIGFPSFNFKDEVVDGFPTTDLCDPGSDSKINNFQVKTQAAS